MFAGSCVSQLGRFLALVLFSTTFLAQSQIRDGGVDPKNLGKGTWIYILPNAINQLGGNVTTVTNLDSMMMFFKNAGLDYVIIKAGDGAALYPASNPQFTSAVVDAGHRAGLKIFGYNRSFGLNIPGEVAIADYVFNVGGDGFVFDAEIEWESHNLANNTVLATQLCSTVRANWPNKFLAHSPFLVISVHSTFPYKEFGYYCDAVMPQAYWIEMGYTPVSMVTKMNQEWRNWQATLSGKWTNSLKPIVAAGQGWSSASGTIDAGQITTFFAALKTNANPATAGGYKGVNFWRAELHPAEVWDAIRTNSILSTPTTAPAISNVRAEAIGTTTASIVWTTDHNSDSVVEFGVTSAYGTSITNSAGVWYHTVNLTGLNPNMTYHYRVRSRNSVGLQSVSGDYVFTTLSASVPDIVLDNTASSVSFSGSWATGTSSLDKYGTDYRFAGTQVSPTSAATFQPSIPVAGDYDVYAWWPQGSNRSTNAPYTIAYNGGSVTVQANQVANGGKWNLLASGRPFAQGTAGYVRLSNGTGVSGVNQSVMADAIKLVYVPPPPSKPSIVTPPQSQTVAQGSTATWTVLASGTQLLSYQWRFNGSAISGATESSYVQNNVQPVHAGNYTVVITNIAGAVTSSVANLTVVIPPSITEHPESRTVAPGSNVLFSVSASGSAPMSYTWKFNGQEIAGATTSAYTVVDAQPEHEGAYSVEVSNEVGSVSSEEALLAVVPPLVSIESVQLLPSGISLQISGGPGEFAIETSANLTEWIAATNLNVTGAVFEYVDADTNQPARFYRAKRLP